MAESRRNETRRTGRVLEIVQLISLRPKQWTRKKLALHYEITERMISKDLEIIRYTLGLPLCTDGNGYYFSSLPRLPAANYSFSEAIALLGAARAAQAIPGINSAELAAAISRLETLFPEQIQKVFRDSMDQVPLRFEKDQQQKMLYLLFQASYLRRKFHMKYRSQGGNSAIERVVCPYAIFPYSRSWYFLALDSHRNEIRLFKVDRVEDGELTSEAYAIPPGFNVDAYFGDVWGVMVGVMGDVADVELIFEEKCGRCVAEERWHKSQRVNILPDGTYQVLFHARITPEMVSWLLSHGADVEIVRPTSLREEVMAKHRRALEKGGNQS